MGDTAIASPKPKNVVVFVGVAGNGNMVTCRENEVK